MLGLASLILGLLIPAHVQSWYYYGLHDENTDVSPAMMARYADFAEDEGHDAAHAMAFKRAGGRYAVAYTDPAYVPYCHPPFAPPAGGCEGPIGDLTTSEDAWLHGPSGARLHHYVDREYDHQEPLNPLSRNARAAFHMKTVLLHRRAPAIDLLFADDVGGPFETWFYGYDAHPVEIASSQQFFDALVPYLAQSTLPMIINGYDDRTGLPSYGGAVLMQPFVRGEARENCFRGDEGIKTDRGDKWRYHANGMLAVTSRGRLAVCMAEGEATPLNRIYVLASVWAVYDPRWTVFANLSRIGRRTLLPELDVVPEKPLETAVTNVDVLRAPDGTYVREFAACYERGRAIGGCAAWINPTGRRVRSRFAHPYARALHIIPGDAEAGGGVAWERAPEELPGESAAILVR